MAQFLPALQKVLNSEGGYVNDPKDPGGETYKGIARKRQADWSGWSIIDTCRYKPGFPTNLEQNIELKLLIGKFYKLSFWDAISGDDITNQAVAESIFDFAINVGVKRGSILAQKVVGASMDGNIGKQTIQLINAFNPDHFLAAYIVDKIAYYIAIIKNRPSSKVYFYGWVCRALGNRV